MARKVPLSLLSGRGSGGAPIGVLDRGVSDSCVGDSAICCKIL